MDTAPFLLHRLSSARLFSPRASVLLHPPRHRCPEPRGTCARVVIYTCTDFSFLENNEDGRACSFVLPGVLRDFFVPWIMNFCVVDIALWRRMKRLRGCMDFSYCFNVVSSAGGCVVVGFGESVLMTLART